MLDLMVEYYLASYENFDFQAPFDDGPEDSIVISRVTINKFGRCRIGLGNLAIVSKYYMLKYCKYYVLKYCVTFRKVSKYYVS